MFPRQMKSILYFESLLSICMQFCSKVQNISQAGNIFGFCCNFVLHSIFMIMENFHDLLVKRHSIRRYTAEEISPDDVQLILEAALMAPSSKRSQPWQFVTVEDRKKLELLSYCKEQGAAPIGKCSLAIVVCADPGVSDVWIEDASIAATYMQLQAEDLGLGSCWIQIRNRYSGDGEPAEDYVRALLDIPPYIPVLCIVTLGHKDEERKPFNPEKMLWERVHIGKWRPQE